MYTDCIYCLIQNECFMIMPKVGKVHARSTCSFSELGSRLESSLLRPKTLVLFHLFGNF